MESAIAMLDRNALKARYLDCIAARTGSTRTLLEVIPRLLHLGVVRATLFRWGVVAGYSPATVRSMLSRAFCALGLRERNPGAGRKPSAEALELWAYSRQRYGHRALRVFRAAYRAGKAQDGANGRVAQRLETVVQAIAVPQVPISRPVAGPQLDPAHPESDAAGRSRPNGRLARGKPRNISETFRYSNYERTTL